MRYLLSALFLLAPTASADTLWLNNGDRITGRLLYFDFNSLAFEADNIGRINVTLNDIRTLESSGQLQLRLKDKDDAVRSQLHPAEPGKVKLDDQQVVALQDIDTLVRLRGSIDRWHWEGNLDLAINLEKERDKDEFEANTKLDTRLFNHRWRHGLKAEVEKKSENSRRTDNNYQANYDLDRFFTEHWFARIHARQHRDYLGDDTTETEAGGGPGYQFWDNEKGRFNMTLQYSRTEYRFNLNLDILPEPNPLELDYNNIGLNWDFQQQIGAHGLELFTKGYVYHPFDVPLLDISVVTSSETGVRYHITDLIHLSFRSDYEYTGLKEKSVVKHHYFLGVGVQW